MVIHIFIKIYFQVDLFWNENLPKMTALYLTHGDQQKQSRMCGLPFKTGFEAVSKNQGIHKTVFKPLILNSSNSTFSYRIWSPVTKASSSQPWGCDTAM